MVKLTEEMVIARSRTSDLTEVKKLNCWGSELTDVSILRELKKVEVLSLSVNKISSLADFQFCLNLKELFVRKNNITDLNEICYLQNLPNLRHLWLAENPCAEQKEYRLTVIKALPNLEKLDGSFVDAEEANFALSNGKTLYNPLEINGSSVQSMLASSEDVAEIPEDAEPEQNRSSSSSSDQRSYDDYQKVNQEYHDVDRRNANHNVKLTHQHSHDNHLSYEFQNGQAQNLTKDNGIKNIPHINGDNSLINRSIILKEHENNKPVFVPVYVRHYGTNPKESRNSREYERMSCQPNQRYQQLQSPPRSAYSTIEYQDEKRFSDRNSYEYEDKSHNHIDNEESYYPPQPRRSSSYQNSEKEDHRERDMSRCMRHLEKDKCHFHYNRRPVTRNSNILSAVLCLVKELDFPSLEVVEMAVRNRMDELDE
ncbi:protein tilB homolog isoform X1 [Chelonus insularis]|uniref:protein tilB homolog isoform X1 n=1 Tax=Chelonus insularis TaxID=460826 RepID=UPI0015899A25|nr:protein tilB homolog isoform X1 [Chelonus insularis]XP_034945460.1 protein tilB homolog isoform X1 [Chelonus insularis]